MNIWDLKISRLSGAASGNHSFHLYTQDNFFVGSLSWNSEHRYWTVGGDKLELEDKYALIRRAQANIQKHNPESYKQSGMPEDPATAVLNVDWWNENRERVMDGLRKKE